HHFLVLLASVGVSQQSRDLLRLQRQRGNFLHRNLVELVKRIPRQVFERDRPFEERSDDAAVDFLGERIWAENPSVTPLVERRCRDGTQLDEVVFLRPCNQTLLPFRAVPQEPTVLVWSLVSIFAL